MPRNGNTKARGYSSQHRAERARWEPEVNAGVVACALCGQAIAPGAPWDLDHTDDRTSYRGPSHRYCNRRAGAIKGNKARGQADQARRWRL